MGLSVSIPLGPVGIFVIQRTISKGQGAGMISGFGAVFADTLYAFIAGFGVKFISDFLVEYQLYIRLIGSAFLMIMGYRIFVSDIIKQARYNMGPVRRSKYLKDFISMFFLTLSNPLTIIAFGAIFAGLGFVQGYSNLRPTAMLIAGVFGGALLWWLTLGTFVNIFRNRIRLRNLFWINKVTGVLIIVLGIAAAISTAFI
ncbi:MAG: LysE family transporter [Bacteroidales bacterium]|nr:LysE family transporter [Bacteroidales bacterium]